MGYSYGLFNTINESIDHFSKVTDTTITHWGYSFEDVRKVISTIVPEIEWGTAEQQEEAIALWSNRSELTPAQNVAMVTAIKNSDPSTYGQVIHPDWGRFECTIDTKYGIVFVETSFHSDYRYLVTNIAKALRLLVFDTQTGELIYNQYNET